MGRSKSLAQESQRQTLVGRTFILALSGLALEIGALTPVGAQQYTAVTIPSPASATSAPLGLAINSTGAVTGFFETDGFGESAPPGSIGATESPTGYSHLFVYSNGNTMDLGDGECGSESGPVGLGINSSGVIAGTQCANTEQPFAFVADGGAFLKIEMPAGTYASFGNAINSSLFVTGTIEFAAGASCPGNIYHPFLNNPNTGVQDFIGSIQALGGVLWWWARHQ